ILMLTGLLSAAAGAVEIEGVKLADTATVAGRDLVLNGAGLRKRLIIDVYVASLYLPAKVSSAAAVLSAEPRRVEIHMLREVGADDFLEAIKDGIEANASQTERDAIQPQLSELAKVITAIGETKNGDAITLDFVAGNTVVHDQRRREDSDRGRAVQSRPAQCLAQRPPRAGRPQEGDAGRLSMCRSGGRRNPVIAQPPKRWGSFFSPSCVGSH
ncbi:MAG: chalcone isomerase family protein, partial [Gammaproteobacteria bacterium]